MENNIKLTGKALAKILFCLMELNLDPDEETYFFECGSMDLNFDGDELVKVTVTALRNNK